MKPRERWLKPLTISAGFGLKGRHKESI